MESEETQSIGDAVRTRRNQVGVSQAELSRVAGVALSTVKRVERGLRPETSTMTMLVSALGCSMPAASGGRSISPVFSAPATRGAIRAVMSRLEAGNSEEFSGLSAYWRDLVSAMATPGGNIPPGYDALRDVVASLPGASADHLDREIAELLERGQQLPTRRGTAHADLGGLAEMTAGSATVHPSTVSGRANIGTVAATTGTSRVTRDVVEIRDTASASVAHGTSDQGTTATQWHPTDPDAILWRAVDLRQITTQDAMAVKAAGLSRESTIAVIRLVMLRRAEVDAKVAAERDAIIAALADAD